jgi:protein involved in ribonucleotide reduction
MSIALVYFSNYSGNTKRFVERLNGSAFRIPISDSDSRDLVMDSEYVLFVPTYGGGSEKAAVPRQVRRFLNVPENRNKLRGVVGFGNTNFGEHFCRAADIISSKTGVPVIAKVEIFGTPEDVERVKERLKLLYGTE